jgi:hypothetical protein
MSHAQSYFNNMSEAEMESTVDGVLFMGDFNNDGYSFNSQETAVESVSIAVTWSGLSTRR